MSSTGKYPGIVKWLARKTPDSLFVRLRYLQSFRRLPNLRNPKTYSEKLQWLKLNYRVAGHEKFVDKHAVKAVVADAIGEEHIIPTIGVYDSFDEIDFDALPNQFVLKTTHDSGGVVVCKDKAKLDVEAARRKLEHSMKRNFFFNSREPHYKHIRPRLIAETYFEDETNEQLLDYKFFCFDGEVKAVFVASERLSGSLKIDYFDAEFNHLDLRQPYPNAEVTPGKPQQYEQMIEFARALSQGHPHVRVDLYEINGEVYFGELTFFNFSGTRPFRPAKWDRIWGDWLTLPKKVRDF